ncbi:hypothetical protein BG000_006377, partial [Podila horticola]
MAAVTGSILSSLFDRLVKEATNLERFLVTASGIQWQETMIQNQADELKQLYKEMEIEKANQATRKAQKVREGEEENRDIILASMQPRRRRDPSPESSQHDTTEPSLSEEATTSSHAVIVQKETQSARSVTKRNDNVQKQVVYQEREEKVWEGFKLLKQETGSAVLGFSSKLDTQTNQINQINQVVVNLGGQLQGFTQTIQHLVQAVENLHKESKQTQRKLKSLETE